MRIPARVLAVLLAVGVTIPASSQDADDEAEVSRPATPSCTTDAAPYRDFDFWIGDWDVFDPDTGRKIGENRITRREQGCLIVEHWESVGGGTGMSMNFYDPLQGAWRQVWQSSAGFIDYSGGLDDEGRMVLEGTIHYNAAGNAQPFRGRWTPRDNGTVLQEFWQQSPESGDWSVWFVGEYRPR